MKREHVLERLGISNAQWVALAIVAGNDYCPNIFGYGFGRCLEILRQMERTAPFEHLLTLFEDDFNAQGHFQTAFRVIACHEQTIEGSPLLDLLEEVEIRLANEREAYLAEKAAFLLEYRSHRDQQAHQPATLQEGWKAGRAGYNRFLPLSRMVRSVMDGKETWRAMRYTYKQVNTSVPSRSPRPDPPKVPRTFKLKERGAAAAEAAVEKKKTGKKGILF
jgi:hypothetical protein